MKYSEILSKAADLIEKDGWTKGWRFMVINKETGERFLKETDCNATALHCAVGAINHVIGGCCTEGNANGDPYELPIIDWVNARIHRPGLWTLVDFNDQHNQRKERVINKLRSLSKIASKEEASLPEGEALVL